MTNEYDPKLEEAMQWAARIWGRPENAHREMDALFAVSIARALREREQERERDKGTS